MGRIGQGIAQLRRDERRDAVQRDTAPGKNPAKNLREIEALTDRERGRRVVAAPAPAPAADRSLDRRRSWIARRAQAANSGTTSRLRAM
jgi:hypothetical protein